MERQVGQISIFKGNLISDEEVKLPKRANFSHSPFAHRILTLL